MIRVPWNTLPPAKRLSGALLALCVAIAATPNAASAQASPPSRDDSLLAAYSSQLAARGEAPEAFVLERLRDHDLIVFDDGVHTSADAFDFYIELVRSREFQELAPVIFLEVLPSNRQAALDAYFSTYPEDPSLLYPAFQDDFGWPYQSYFDLLHEIYRVNRTLPAGKTIAVKAVSTPSLWGEIRGPADWAYKVDIAPLARDYFMYALIFDGLDGFRSGRKGIFLTNTRHAYTHLKFPDGGPVKSTTGFFNLWRPGRAYSIRIDAPVLVIRAHKAAAGGAKTAAGMEDYDFGWGRTADGLWDDAFRAYGARPVAIPLADTAFGDAPYLGNLMLSVAKGQAMRDAYDAAIFLKPFEAMRKTAKTGAIYTPAFRRELERRYRLSRTPAELAKMLKDDGVRTLRDYVAKEHRAEPSVPLPEAAAAGPIDGWRGQAAEPARGPPS